MVLKKKRVCERGKRLRIFLLTLTLDDTFSSKDPNSQAPFHKPSLIRCVTNLYPLAVLGRPYPCYMDT